MNNEVILIAEDDENDLVLLLRAFEQAHILNPVQIVRDGEQVIAYLQGRGKFSNRVEFPLPTLLLLDLKMPRKNGFEVLEWVRKQPTLQSLRIVVLTISEQMKDVNDAYQLGANSFLVKPGDFQDFVNLIRAVNGYWIWTSKAPSISRLPQERSPQDKSATRKRPPSRA